MHAIIKFFDAIASYYSRNMFQEVVLDFSTSYRYHEPHFQIIDSWNKENFFPAPEDETHDEKKCRARFDRGILNERSH